MMLLTDWLAGMVCGGWLVYSAQIQQKRNVVQWTSAVRMATIGAELVSAVPIEPHIRESLIQSGMAITIINRFLCNHFHKYITMDRPKPCVSDGDEGERIICERKACIYMYIYICSMAVMKVVSVMQ